MEALGYITCALLLILTTDNADCQRVEDFCKYKSSKMVSSVTLGADKDSKWSGDDACRCVVTPNFNTSRGNERLITLAVDLEYSSIQDADQPQCLPMLLVQPTRKPFASNPTDPLTLQYNVCPEIDDTLQHTGTLQVFKGQEFIFHLYNPQRQMLISKIAIHGFDGSLLVTCDQYERIMYEEEDCPCPAYSTGGWRDRTQEEFDEKRRLMIGLVTAFVFAAVIVAIIVGAVFYKRRKAKRAARSSSEAVTVENKAYQGSKQSVTSDTNKNAAKKDANVNYAPDPNLNLKLQQPGHHGSRDSGLASSNDNERARLPFMQPTPAARSLENLNQMPDNHPNIAGQGSMSSLDNTVEPVYTTRKPPRPPQADQGSQGASTPHNTSTNYPPLAGHGSQSSLNRLGPQYDNVDDVYAKPMKRPEGSRPTPPQPERSQSYDNMAGPAILHSSLNRSTNSIETDI